MQTWKEVLADIKEKDFFKKAFLFQKKQRENGKKIFPPEKEIFNAFTLTPFEEVKVVILGQDPYHGEGQAEGLCFSVGKNISHPPSLQNIFKELQNDLGLDIPKDGSLRKWAKQGVFLLNAILTVEKSKPASHAKIGWEHFTDEVIKKISNEKDHVVFVLWGNFAKGKIPLIDKNKHTIITAPHPSPFSVHSGFFGSKPFSKINDDLRKHKMKEINWSL
jgi:uracil-DNA glycosylase